ncbi:hypothetical protein [Alphaproteobacteria bacterium endosymbiont of Tiliacea citrago]|uniref:type II secretion system protein n=1 Tax=Alphaproteobacteria bacterium endosymbiont of Tiliacea citrago TaxID=3077944 RepID=UPI00313DFBE0
MKKIKAFSLLECALALMLIGICLNSFLIINKKKHQSSRKEITKLRANYIRKAIEGYVATHGFLPYASETLDGTSSLNCTVGYLPYKTLGLSKIYAYDGSGNAFRFIVDKNLVLEYQKSLGYLIFPPFFPSENFIMGIRTWNRLNSYYSYVNNRLTKKDFINFSKKMLWQRTSFLYEYDDMNDNFRILIIKNKRELGLSKIFIYPIFDMRRGGNFNFEEIKKNYLLCDTIAWVLISDKKIDIKKMKYDKVIICLDQFEIVFWQSRFNISYQIKNVLTSKATFLGINSYCGKYLKY